MMTTRQGINVKIYLGYFILLKLSWLHGELSLNLLFLLVNNIVVIIYLETVGSNCHGDLLLVREEIPCVFLHQTGLNHPPVVALELKD